MAVNVQLAPSKGMTLPFISYGGSVDAGAVDRHGLAARLHAPEPVSDALALCREMERGEPDRMNFVLAAGGTGGHMVPAHALAAELKSRGHGVLLITDERGARFPGPVRGRAGAHPAGRAAGRRADRLAQGGAVGARRAAREAKRLYREHRPDAVVGFGGYPAFPSLLAASAMRIPTVLHEQNAVLGRVNRLLAGEADGDRAPPTTQVDRLKPRYAGQDRAGRQSGPRGDRPARRSCRSRRSTSIAPLKILVTGGSQGATVLGEVVPEGLGLLDAVAAPPAAGRPAMPARRHRAGAQRAMPSSAFRPS